MTNREENALGTALVVMVVVAVAGVGAAWGVGTWWSRAAVTGGIATAVLALLVLVAVAHGTPAEKETDE